MCRQQELFYRIDQHLGTDRHAYHDVWAIRMRGSLDLGRLRETLDLLTELHPVFRTCHTSDLRQHLARQGAIEYEFDDLSGLTTTEADRQSAVIATQAKIEPYDLANGRTLRARVIRRAERDHVLLLGAHHITNDAWSASLINRSISAGYRGGADALPVESVSYADYGAWQRDQLTAGRFAPQIAYWTSNLEGVAARVPLRAHRRGPAGSYLGETRIATLPEGLTAAARTAAATAGVGEFAFYLAAYAILVTRQLAEDDDIVIGSPAALRNYGELATTVGFFANMLAYRIKVRANQRWCEHLHRVNEVCLNALDNQEAPFLTVLERLGLADTGPHPVTNVTFALPGAGERIGERIRIPGVQTSLLTTPVAPTMSKFDFSLSVHTRIEPGQVVAVYNRHLFDGRHVDQLLARYTGLLATAIDSPDTTLAALAARAGQTFVGA